MHRSARRGRQDTHPAARLLHWAGGSGWFGKRGREQSAGLQPLFWADGITRLDHLPAYARTGFNTVVVHLFWAPTEDGSIVASDLEPQRNFAAAARRQGLNIIYRLPPAHTLTVTPAGMQVRRYWSLEPGPELRLPSDAAYAEAFLDGERKTHCSSEILFV